MKKVLIIMMAVLLIGALFISCSQQVQEDRLGSVDISFQESRTLDVTVTSDIKPVSDLVWYYTAIKTSGLYATGQKTTLTKIGVGLVSGTKLDDFSTGGWKFSFYGFNTESESSDTENAVYYAKDIEITVVAEQSNPVNIALSVGKIGKGKVVFTGLSVDLSSMILRTGGTLTLNIKQDDAQKATFTSGEVTGPAIYSLKSGEETTVTLDGIDQGTYTYIFSVVYTLGNESVEVAEEEWQVTVNNGTVVTFEGDVLKTNELADVVIGEVTGETEAEAVIEPTSLSDAKSYTVEISPASVSNPDSVARTTVSFPENVLDSVITADAEQTLTSSKVTIDVTDTVEASTKFIVVGESSSAFAGINLDLYKTVTTTTTEESTTSKIVNPFFATPVTVETYIAKGLTGVTVEYQANEGDVFTSHPVASTDLDKIAVKQADVYATDAAMGDKLGYSQQSGLLRFTTTHFSEFVVDADQNVYDKTTNTAYKLSEREDKTKGFLLDAAGKKVTANINDEYVLLDSTKANLVHDDIDNFNAGYSWTAIHSSNEADMVDHDKLDGYGTKIEPYAISSYLEYEYLLKLNKTTHSSGAQIYHVGNPDTQSKPQGTYVVFDRDIDFNYDNPLNDDNYDTNRLNRYNLYVDGKGHKLSNVYGALFGVYNESNIFTYWDFTIKNLILDNFYGSYYGSAIAYCGAYQNSGITTVDGVSVIFNAKSSQWYGSLFGWTSNSGIVIKNCSVTNACVKGGSGMCIGGFVANGQNVTIDNCSFGGSVTSTDQNAAGFIGQGGTSCVIKDSTIASGSIIRNNGAGKTVQAFGTATLSGNSFNGLLLCDRKAKASQYTEGGQWQSINIISSDSFELGDNGVIEYKGTNAIASVRVDVTYAIDRLVKDVSPVRFDGYMPAIVLTKEFSNIQPNAVLEDAYQVIKNLVNVVSPEYKEKVFNGTDDESVLIEGKRLKESSFYYSNGIVYVDGRGGNPAFFSGSAKYENGDLVAQDIVEARAYLIVYAYDSDGNSLGNNSLSYTFSVAPINAQN